MRIAIISDIHDNQVNLKKFLLWARDEDIDKLICCGDVTDGETLNILATGFEGGIFLVKGNAEIYNEKDIEKYDNIEYGGKQAVFSVDGSEFGLCHEPFLADKILERGPVPLIFCGHTHKPWIEDKNGAKLVNPGTLGGMFARATFAFWDNSKNKLDLKILDLI